jgi:hypothetical protein
MRDGMALQPGDDERIGMALEPSDDEWIGMLFSGAATHDAAEPAQPPSPRAPQQHPPAAAADPAFARLRLALSEVLRGDVSAEEARAAIAAVRERRTINAAFDELFALNEMFMCDAPL